ncbi:MAG: YeeE/YedE family protein [Pseudomonadota bacterium]
MTEFTPVSATLGGALIGLAAAALLLLNGRVAGISGIVNGAMNSTGGERTWRLAFIVGLIGGGLVWQWLAPAELPFRSGFPLPLLIAAGLAVGYGTRLGSGCTSGHGVCGLGRLSARSLVATAVFMASGIVTVAIVRLLFGGVPGGAA